ncbi:MAG: hypothetical protein ACRDKY_03630 [Solirubrobacteraceae bacterium]
MLAPALVVTALAAGAIAAAPASAAADGPPGTKLAMPWCGKTIWKSGLLKKVVMLKRLNKVVRIADNVDSATDLATALLTIITAGAVAVPNAVIKIVAKVGKSLLKKVVKKLRADAVKVKAKRVGVRVKVGCVWGAIPYPSIGVYT